MEQDKNISDNVYKIGEHEFIFERVDEHTTQLSTEITLPDDAGDVIVLIQGWWDKKPSFDHCTICFDNEGTYLETIDGIDQVSQYLSHDVIKGCYIKLIELSL